MAISSEGESFAKPLWRALPLVLPLAATGGVVDPFAEPLEGRVRDDWELEAADVEVDDEVDRFADLALPSEWAWFLFREALLPGATSPLSCLVLLPDTPCCRLPEADPRGMRNHWSAAPKTWRTGQGEQRNLLVIFVIQTAPRWVNGGNRMSLG